MTNKEKTKNVVQTGGQEIRAFALPYLLERSPIAVSNCAKFERQFGFTQIKQYVV